MAKQLQRIYIADDEKNIRELIQDFLKSDGYLVTSFETGDALWDACLKEMPDLIILDIMMPGTDGLTICKKIRELSDVPIIILTAKDSELDYVQGITFGSDDYLTKPFRPTILLMRVRSLLRRVEMDNKQRKQDRSVEVKTGDLVFHMEKNSVFCKGREMMLTQMELKTLVYMMKHPENAFSREELLNHIWGYDSSVESRVADETMRRIRRKLSEMESCVSVQTVWGFGYRLKIQEELG